MPRSPRLSVPGGIHHITARGNRRQVVFHEPGDQRRFCEPLGDVAERFEWRVYAYCLMPNHYHLVLRENELGLSRGIQHLNSVYAQWFNRRHGLGGHLFQGRFHSVLVQGNWHLLQLERYLAMNPVQAGLCSSPEKWPWSSYGAISGIRAAPPFLSVSEVLLNFGNEELRARRRFRAFVREVHAPR